MNNKVSIKQIANELAMDQQIVLIQANKLFKTHIKSVLKRVSDEQAAKLYEFLSKNSSAYIRKNSQIKAEKKAQASFQRKLQKKHDKRFQQTLNDKATEYKVEAKNEDYYSLSLNLSPNADVSKLAALFRV